MENAKGYIYILTNPSFPDYVKIGYADDVERRVQQLNNTECTPYAFHVYATYEVDSRLMDIKFHTIIDKLNPSLRSIEQYNGRIRKREFFEITAEDAFSVFEAMAEIHGCKDRLKLWATTADEIIEEEMAETISSERKARHSNYTFDHWNIPAGAELVHIENPDIRCVVIDTRRVEYEGKILYMTPFVKMLGTKTCHGPGYVGEHFSYNGKSLKEIEQELYGKQAE
ncbi:MAG: GIY-YIG nuclease family protein [Oscillospiraceae bacterium]|nr:GIY-YIG nuclease family protein [Oscillospiraceae bacterium]